MAAGKESGKWAADGEKWDMETGAPEVMHFANAIQVWAICQEKTDVTVAEAAAAFKVPPQRIVEALEDLPWMFVAGPDDDYSKMTIEHDGE
jgi:hypothetical protein